MLSKEEYDVIILGSTLPGLSCAVELVSKKHKVLVVEQSSHWGGRSQYWDENGVLVDSKFRSNIGVYKNFQQLLKKVGLDPSQILESKKISVLGLGSINGEKNVTSHKSPIYLLDFFNQTRDLKLREKTILANFLLGGLIAYWSNSEDLYTYTIEEYVNKKGVPLELVNKFLFPLVTVIFSIKPKDCCAYNFFGVFANMLINFKGVTVATFQNPIGHSLIAPIVNYVKTNGGEVAVNTGIEKILLRKNNVEGIITKQGVLFTENLVLATGLSTTQRLIRASNIQGFNKFLMLKSAPEVLIEIELRSSILDESRFYITTETFISTLIEKRNDSKNTIMLYLTLFPAERFLKLTREEILGLVIKETKRLDVNLEGNVRNFRVIRLDDATYSIAPGSEMLRPTQKTHIKGLYLAGSYTKQKFFYTAEGAVVAGKLAAKEVIKNERDVNLVYSELNLETT